jgi:tRNA-Thr(GGU) m(6)t(6)A37 methyltransferase TsaA
LAIGVTGP